jgi:hypothetical protein
MRLRTGAPPVFPRVHEGKVLLDLRTIFPDEDAEVAAALARLSDAAPTASKS